MKKQLLLLSIVAIVGVLARLNTTSSLSDSGCKIAILQTASHPALDLVCQSFKSELKSLSSQFCPDKHFVWLEQNGMGQVSTLQTMASHFHNQQDIQLILAIATPATQTLVGLEKKIPIIYTAVSDPKILGPSLKQSNVCGLSDGVCPQEQLKLLLNLWPCAQKIAIIYNPSESNSETAVKQLSKLIEESHLEPVLCAALNPSEIPSATSKAIRNADIVFVPADNLVAMTLPLIANLCHKANIPLMAGYTGAVEQGADISYGVNYEKMGRSAAHLALEILKQQKTPYQIGQRDLEPSLNLSTAAKQSLNQEKSND